MLDMILCPERWLQIIQWHKQQDRKQQWKDHPLKQWAVRKVKRGH